MFDKLIDNINIRFTVFVIFANVKMDEKKNEIEPDQSQESLRFISLNRKSRNFR